MWKGQLSSCQNGVAEETVLSLEPVDCWQAVRKGAQRDRELFREGEIERKAAECWENSSSQVRGLVCC